MPVTVDISLKASYRADINFNFLARPYTFVVTKWRANAQARFYQLFHAHSSRDPAMFGTVGVDGIPNMTGPQKIEAIMQAIVDIFITINAILVKHQRGVLDYAIWYRERAGDADTYSKYITLVACHCIVHANLLVPTITWERVEFS